MCILQLLAAGPSGTHNRKSLKREADVRAMLKEGARSPSQAIASPFLPPIWKTTRAGRTLSLVA